MLAAFQKMDPKVIGRYVRGWQIIECSEGHPDYGKVLAEVSTKREAQTVVNTQRLPEQPADKLQKGKIR